MSDIIDISNLNKEFKEEADKQKFLEVQTKTILELSKQNKQLQEEITHLKQLLSENSFNPPVEKIIVTPEQALIDSQIDIIQTRSYLQELSLEDVKKLDLLLKNKFLIKKDSPETIKGDSKPQKLSLSKLLEIASKNEPSIS